MLLQKQLSSFGIESNNIALVDDGKAALDSVSEKPYDLIIMDCHMPNMDGYEAAIAIRDMERSSNKSPTPILAVTSDEGEEIRQKCIKSGMNDYICKPVDTETLHKTIGQWFCL